MLSVCTNVFQRTKQIHDPSSTDIFLMIPSMSVNVTDVGQEFHLRIIWSVLPVPYGYARNIVRGT